MKTIEIRIQKLIATFLTICITDAITFEAVQNAVTDNLPSGDAKLAWKNICNINQPVTASEQHDLEQQFYQCTLADEHTNPDNWFVKLENIRITLKNDHNHPINDEQMVTQILYTPLPSVYKTTVFILKRELDKSITKTLNLNDIKQER